MRAAVVRPAVVALLAAGEVALALPAGGGLDPSFSGDGWVRTLEVRSPFYLPRGARDVAIQSDGKLVVVGEIQDGRSHRDFGVFRYTAAGDLDSSFAGRGYAAVDLGSSDLATAVAVQRDGRIVVAGEADCPRSICFALVRFHPDGSVDGSFGRGGVMRTECGCRPYDVAVQPDGKIVAAGWRRRGGDGQDDELFAVGRYLSDGSLDRTFAGRLGLRRVRLRRRRRPRARPPAGRQDPRRRPRRARTGLRRRPFPRRRPAGPLVLRRRAADGRLRQRALRHGVRARPPARRPDRRRRRVGNAS